MSAVSTMHLNIAESPLRDVSLTIPAHSCYGIVGERNSGKSLLINILAGCHGIASQQVRIGNQSALSAMPTVGVMSPSLDLPKQLSPFQILRDTALLRGIEGPNLMAHCQRALRWCAMEPYANRPLGTLSRFNRLRTALALAVLHRPVVLLLDEPTSGLLAQEQQAMIDVIENLRDRSMTIVIATRGAAPLESLFDAVGVLAHGQIVAELSGQQVRDLPRTIVIRTNDIPTAADEHIQALDEGIIVTRRNIVLTGNGIQSLAQILQVLLHYNVHIFRIEPRNHPLADLVSQARQPQVLQSRYPARIVTSPFDESGATAKDRLS